MEINIVDRSAAFEALRPNWNDLYAADPEAHLFLSWEWMSRWFREMEANWLVLAARPGPGADRCVGLLPLKLGTRPLRTGGFYTEVAMAGSSFADYTGILLHPDHAAAAIDAFARCIKGMSWGCIRFEKMRMRDEHRERFIRHFSPRKLDVHLDLPMRDSAGVDNSVCPFVPLPESWEEYLAGLSTNTRQKLRRLLRNLDADADLRVTHASAQTIDLAIEILIGFWARQWSARKGDRLGAIRDNLRTMLGHYFDLGILYMPVLWKGSDPVGVLASLVDARKRVMHFFVGARDECCDSPPPGLTLHAHSIRDAIGMGLRRYDFLRGNEPYKYSFGAIERRIHNATVRVKPVARAKSVLDPRSIPQALALVRRQRAAGLLAEAEVGYRQILSVDPGCEAAMLGYGELMRVKDQAPGLPAPPPALDRFSQPFGGHLVAPHAGPQVGGLPHAAAGVRIAAASSPRRRGGQVS